MAGKLDRAMSSIMAKLEATVAGALGSDGESLCDSPTSPPLLSPASSAAKLLPFEFEEARRRGLKFSIDNILKPEFGSPSSESSKSDSSRLSLSTSGDSTSQLFRPKPSPLSRSVGLRSPPLSPECKSASVTPPLTPGAPALWPAWVYCTRYSDRPSSGPRCRKVKRKAPSESGKVAEVPDEKRPRTAFSPEQLNRLKQEFQENRYLTEKRRQELAHTLGLNESQIKIWFQNKRAKMKKQAGFRNPLAFALMTQGLYNHATVPIGDGEEEDEKNEG